MVSLSIVTPTYNRCNEIKNLYYSLEKQTNKNFQWLVIDDGSSDLTECFFDGLNADFRIDYKKKSNGGKPSAINFSHGYILSDIVAIVDSDDLLTEDAVDQIINKWEKYKNNPKICGLVFLRKHPGEKIPNSPFPYDGYIGSYIDVILSSGVDGGCFEVVRKSLLEEFPFPEFKNEKFIGESYLWTISGLKYDMVFNNIPLYIYDFLDGGLTSQGRLLRIKNPRGSMEVQNIGLEKRVRFKRRIKNAILYVCYGKFCDYNFFTIVKMSRNKRIVICNYLFGIMLYFKWRREFLLKRDKK